MKRQMVIELISALLIFLFFYTAISKIADFEQFKNTLYRSPLIKNYNVVIAWTLPAGELIAGILLLLPVTRLVGFYLSLILLAIFTGYLGILLLFYNTGLPCSCGGVLKQMTWKQHVLFNIAFLILNIYGIFLTKLNK